MIPYVRTEWYGMGYLTRLTGSQLPHCLPWAIVSGAMGAFFASGVLDRPGHGRRGPRGERGGGAAGAPAGRDCGR